MEPFTIGISMLSGIIIIAIVIWIFARGRGRLAEEQQEEADTIALRKDEKKAEKAERDEKKECDKIKKDLDQIESVLKSTKRGDLRDKMLGSLSSAHVAINKLREENMNEARAVEMFQKLHKSISEVIEYLKDVPELIFIVKKLQKHQSNFYKDLVKEIQMTRDEKKRVMNLWREIRQKESGSDVQQVARAA